MVKTKYVLKTYMIFMFFGLTFCSCQNFVRSENLSLIEMSMSKQDVQRIFGNSGKPIFCKIDKNQEVNEILEFDIVRDVYFSPTSFWFRFINNKLVQYGRPIDFQDNIKKSSLELKIGE